MSQIGQFDSLRRSSVTTYENTEGSSEESKFIAQMGKQRAFVFCCGHNVSHTGSSAKGPRHVDCHPNDWTVDIDSWKGPDICADLTKPKIFNANLKCVANTVYFEAAEPDIFSSKEKCHSAIANAKWVLKPRGSVVIEMGYVGGRHIPKINDELVSQNFRVDYSYLVSLCKSHIENNFEENSDCRSKEMFFKNSGLDANHFSSGPGAVIVATLDHPCDK